MAKKILKGVANVATFGLAGAAIKALVGKKKAPAAVAAPDDGPVVMPLADDEKVRAARKKSIAMQMSRSGRASTILTDSSDKLGG